MPIVAVSTLSAQLAHSQAEVYGEGLWQAWRLPGGPQQQISGLQGLSPVDTVAPSCRAHDACMSLPSPLSQADSVAQSTKENSGAQLQRRAVLSPGWVREGRGRP